MAKVSKLKLNIGEVQNTQVSMLFVVELRRMWVVVAVRLRRRLRDFPSYVSDNEVPCTSAGIAHADLGHSAVEETY